MAKQLTRKQQRLCEIIVSHPEFSHEQAAVEAGYQLSGARGRASYNLRQPHVRRYIDELRKILLPALNRENVAFRLQEIIEIPLEAHNFNPNARVSAAREVGRMYGWGKEEVHHTHELEGLEDFTVVFHTEDEVDDGESS
ncbi:hypothetical protein LCGC14_0491290 [marine sediment metagenome]|uniref:Terminase small subunit n=1 Tax=marine sediment metagenome TaxID=412755 RepID=A0A0F9UTJ9_9ZZZZ